MTLHVLPANEQTVKVGVIKRHFAPVLEVADGDEVVLQTWGHWGNAVTPDATLADIAEFRSRYPGVGPHSMTGPIAVRGARPGMTLRVDILDLELGSCGFNLIVPQPRGRGLLTHQFPKAELRHFIFDRDRMETRLGSGLTIKLRPFLGIMGVAPDDDETHSSSVPGNFGGNLDCAELVAGTTLYLPILVEGALFYAGDAHAVQGSGEVDQTAIETSMKRAHLRLSVVPERLLARPHATTPTHMVTMGFNPDLRQAAIDAVDDMVTWVARDHGLSRSEAYVLCSLQADLMITQAVNVNNGVHARLATNLFTQGSGTRSS